MNAVKEYYISPDLTALELFRRKIFETSANQT